MIPFLDLQAQHNAIADEVRAAIDGVLARGQLILGPEVTAFEQEFAAFLGAQHAVGVASGTDALTLALRACDIGPGDEVITVTNTAVATVAAIELAGATPVFADIDPATFNVDPSKVEAVITPRTKALLPVHLYGQSADLAPLLDIARRRGLWLIEDACQAHGAEYRGKRVGTTGDIGCFSFYPTKNLGGYGDGGMVTTNDPALADKLRLLRTYGWAERDRSVIKGANSRLDELHAAILRVKLRRLDAWNERRRTLAHRYKQALSTLDYLRLPVEAPYGKHVYHLFVVRSADRTAIRAHLTDRGVGTLIHYPHPIHLQDAYRNLGLTAGALPESERAASEIFSLPLHPFLSDEAADGVVQALTSFRGG